ncbi:MAG: hypothetical protein DMG87_02590 [Acidobacteria bacterium]|nr:MAG: hypothetical protein DMG87_02590 [Acidobacteriota bacterium]
MASQDTIAAAIESGRKKAEEILASRSAALERRAASLAANTKTLALRVHIAAPAAAESVATLQTAGFLAAAGDSWFDYPFHDVLKILEDDYGYNVESTAHKGDPIEKMAYHGGQIDGFARKLEKIKAHGAIPKAVLLSGGGDDVAGNEFGMLLNNAFSPIAGLDKEVVDGVLNERIIAAYASMLASITASCEKYFSKKLPILVHGYDYPVPDGRGFLGGWPFPGPWLDPGFREKNFGDLAPRVRMMKDLMDQFNEMVASLSGHPGLDHVHYVDLRKTLSNNLVNDDYKAWWANELHPSDQGFHAVTKKFAAALEALP